ncbi:MAG TPA: type II CAAX endopeptidase family protein [Terriglobales bacterium]|nr:type II CAAX endopeptidase family protein [Terriglobales bacterium]
MSSLENPLSDPGAPLGPEVSVPQARPPIEDPVWNGWDVFWIVMVALFSIVFCVVVVTYAAQKLLYPGLPLMEVAKFPLVGVIGQAAAYVVVLLFMVSVVEGRIGQNFWRAIQWNWPKSPWLFVAGGVVLSVGLQLFANLLPMPKGLPIERFFQTSREAWTLSVFGVTMAPLLEEFFFRGFLYPVLARRLGLGMAVALTSVAFGLIHAPQLGQAWGPVLVVFLVGVALTLTRAKTRSVASSLLVHAAYNGTLSVLLYVGSDGFRHLEKLNQ